MRLVISLLAMLLCTSCASTYEPTTMLLDNRQLLRGTLVSVMDSVIVLDLFCQRWDKATSKSTLGLCVIPMSRVREVRVPGRDHTGSGALYGGMLVGGMALIGGIVGYEENTAALIDPGPLGNGIIATIVFTPFGAGVGALLGFVGSEAECIINPSSRVGAQALRAKTGHVRHSPAIWRHWSYTPPRQRQ